MTEKPSSDIAFTPAVKAIQTEKGSRHHYEDHQWSTTSTPTLEAFLDGIDMFYLGTASADGRPYVQYRGGPPGFLKLIDDKTLAFADYGGNQQYISVGNLSENPRAFIFLMDYANSKRLKIWGHAKVVEDDPQLLERLHSDSGYRARVERAIVFTIDTWSLNCPQHIHKRLPVTVVAPMVEKLQSQITELQQRLSRYEDVEVTDGSVHARSVTKS